MDETGVLALLDELSDILEDSKPAFGSKDKRTVEIGPVLDILDDIRHAFPEEFAQARQVVRERQSLLEDAEIEANRILEDARSQALIVASEQEIVRIAQQQAENVLADARDMERETRAGADDYADWVFSQVESMLGQASENVTRCRDRLNNKGIR
ncbi:MAG: ATPase [Coriobacteriia bacterium]|jgi:F0F1-type ATP synthase membrane subunit b/b'|nr:ATPase [Coriobacteriia bacterium]MDR2714991.1 ATPase [Coriobacteriales bacterium]